MIWFIGVPFIILVVIPFLLGFYDGIKHRSIIPLEDEEIEDIHLKERIELLDNTLVQYVKLLDNLAEQYRNETDDKKRGAILKQQITALEKYNRALEKREKLDN